MPVTEFQCNTCDLRISLGWYHCGEFQGWSEMFIACRACGAQHRLKIAPLSQETRSVEITYVPEQDRGVALRLIYKHCNCTPIEAKALLDHLPVRLTERVTPGRRSELQDQVSSTGITLGFPAFDGQDVDQLLCARRPRHGIAEPEWDEVKIIKKSPPGNEEITQAYERYSAGELTWEEFKANNNPGPSNNKTDLSIQRCNCCSAVGTLTGDHNLFTKCPQCKQTTLETVSQWIS